MTEIIVLDEGRAIAQGPHDLLMKTSPDYRQIAETQMGGMACGLRVHRWAA